MRPWYNKVSEVQEGYWVVLRLMRLLSRDPTFISASDYKRTLDWLLTRMTEGVLYEAISLLEKEDRSYVKFLTQPELNK